MSLCRSAALGLLLLLAPSAAADAMQIPSWIGRFLGLGRTASVMQWVDEQRTGGNDELALNAVEASVLTRDERYTEALVLFEQAERSQFYERVGIRYHADALREAGWPLQAAALRQEHIDVSGLSVTQAYTEARQRIYDLLFADHLGAALGAAEDLVGDYPQSASSWSTLADVHVARGELDDAHIALTIGERKGKKGHRQVAPTRLRAFLAEGDLDAATAQFDEVGRRIGARRDYWASYLEYELAMDNPGYVLTTLDRQRFARNQSPWYRALRARALSRLGDRNAAWAVLDALLQDYPTHPAARTAADELEAADQAP